MSTSIPPSPAELERLAGLIRHELTGSEVVVVPSAYSADPRGAVRVRLGHRAFLDLADDGAAWFVAGLWSDQGGETPPGERRRELLAVPLRADAPVVATAVVASVWRWVEAIGPREADAPFTRSSRSAPPAIPGPAVFGAPAPAPYATAAPATGPFASAAPATTWSAPAARPRRPRKGLLIGGLVAAGLLVLTGGTVAAVAVAHTAAELASASSPGGGSVEAGGDPGDAGGDPDDTGSDPGATGGVPDISAFDLAVGDCFALGEGDATGSGEIDGVELQSCNDQHDNEAYLVFDATQASWPGERALWDLADEGCSTGFEAFVGIPWDESVADYAYLTPTEQSWSEGDHDVLCYAWIEGDTSPGTLEGYGY
ncbi:hypothetical protein ES689_14615 [Frigoribacterium sp. ACAM 257]|uniref:septum formation family protein n=1 Tax=Frigoribacterium sp. ACAM 257 TaxID=2508998 RepID=UPI0011BA08B5|nr:septum formation family protein [Frigoribacterium sp. ACAM 257]TWX34545.1 hypothetical protein ES689_14615 [Frigoribacterium sp. ACAM 257]